MNWMNAIQSVKQRMISQASGRPAPDLQADLRRARKIADWLDTKFNVAGVRFGLEALLGLVPVVGDTVGALAGMYPIYVANRHRLGKAVQARMALNLAIEFGAGAIPWLGDAIDVAFKANIRNVRLLESAAARRSQFAGT